jgi:hypothetical protein
MSNGLTDHAWLCWFIMLSSSSSSSSSPTSSTMIGGGCRYLPPPEGVVPAPACPDAATALPRRSGALIGGRPWRGGRPPLRRAIRSGPLWRHTMADRAPWLKEVCAHVRVGGGGGGAVGVEVQVLQPDTGSAEPTGRRTAAAGCTSSPETSWR